MNCVKIRKLLSLEDETLRPDPGGLREHIARCESCRAEHPEIVHYLGVAGASTPPGGGGARPEEWRSPVLLVAAVAAVAAAASLLGFAALWWAAPERTPPPLSSVKPVEDAEVASISPVHEPVNEARTVPLGARVSRTSHTVAGDRSFVIVVESEVIRSVPSCLARGVAHDPPY